MNRCSSYILAVMMLVITGCSTVLVDSSPPRAKVLIDGKDTGRLTPAGLRVRDLHSGYRNIELRKEGYVSSYQTLTVRVSAGKILMSWFPPMLFKFGIGDCWKIAGPGRIRLILEPSLATLNTSPPVKKPAQETQSGRAEAKTPSATTEDVITEKLNDLEALLADNLITEEECRQKRQSIIDNF